MRLLRQGPKVGAVLPLDLVKAVHNSIQVHLRGSQQYAQPSTI